ncbi:head-tail joining protein [Burkholderia contaminans]|uniref:head-tail joining protein n=1 Tax=Burkholderia contaminans TaxID=488447 RepID=UPI000863A07E|nr:hypothetical protein [Burkholderia contaminans]AOL04148.1 hypothetical protein WI95_09600 [Burkholderia contaminans]
MAFRDLIADVDAAVLRDLGDAEITLDGKPVEGMFASPWLGPDLGSQRTQLVAPVFRLQDSAAVAVRQGSVLIASGDRYRVLEAHPDGTGWTILILQ